MPLLPLPGGRSFTRCPVGLPEITRPLRTHLALKGRTHFLSLQLICLDGESPPLSLHLTSAQEDSMRFNLC